MREHLEKSRAIDFGKKSFRTMPLGLSAIVHLRWDSSTLVLIAESRYYIGSAS